MRRLTGIVTVVGMVFAAVPAGAAVDPPMVCPDMFAPAPETTAPPGTDKNGNGIVCVKEADGILVYKDDLLMP